MPKRVAIVAAFIVSALMTGELVLLGYIPSLLSPGLAHAGHEEKARDVDYPVTPPAPLSQTREEADEKSLGCRSCHTATDQPTMHSSAAVVLGCSDCHGGDAS